jgi:hypothetical protein
MIQSVIFTLKFEGGRGLGLVTGEPVTLKADRVGQTVGEVGLHVSQVHSIVGALGAREGWLD